MEFNDLIQKRYSVRKYKSEPVEDKKLELILEAARLAPTAHNKQPFQLIVIKTNNFYNYILSISYIKYLI